MDDKMYSEFFSLSCFHVLVKTEDRIHFRFCVHHHLQFTTQDIYIDLPVIFLYHQVAKFLRFTAWNCEKGAEAVNGGALQFREFILVNNELAGYEGKEIVKSPPQYDEANGPGIFDSLIVAHHDDHLPGSATKRGLIIPYQSGFLVKNVKFVNFVKVFYVNVMFLRRLLRAIIWLHKCCSGDGSPYEPYQWMLKTPGLHKQISHPAVNL